MGDDINERAVLGGNNPPEPTPYELSKAEIEDLYNEARLWLDGTAVETQEQADAINTLKDSIKKAAKKADENYVAEVKPHQDTVKEIQARYNELTGSTKSVTGMAVKAEQACNKALLPYLMELDRLQKEAAKKAREEAEKKQAQALEAMRSRDAANLVEREEAEKLVEAAKAAEADARKAEGQKAHARGTGRATGLRTVWKPVCIDTREAAVWAYVERREELNQFVQDLAEKAVRSGARSIRGFDVIEEKVL